MRHWLVYTIVFDLKNNGKAKENRCDRPDART